MEPGDIYIRKSDKKRAILVAIRESKVRLIFSRGLPFDLETSELVKTYDKAKGHSLY